MSYLVLSNRLQKPVNLGFICVTTIPQLTLFNCCKSNMHEATFQTL